MTNVGIRTIRWLADKFSKGHGAIISTVSTIIILLSLFIIRNVYPDTLRIIVESHVFEAVVLWTLLQILILLIRPSEEVQIITSDIECQRRIMELVRKGDISRADILSAGLSSRRSLIPEILENKVEVNVLAQHPDVAIDKEDGQRLIDSLGAIKQNLTQEAKNRFKVRFYFNTASIRAIVLRGKTFEPTYAFIGWYNYHSRNTKIAGRPNPSVLISDRQKEGKVLIDFLDKIINLYSTQTESQEQTT